jgi:type IV secretion system protein VirB10
MKRSKKHRQSESSAAPDEVRGERGVPSVSAERSLQSRVSSIMACGLMIILGAAMLTWYYSGAISRQSRAQRSAQAAISHRAQGEMPLPALDGFNSLKTSSVDTPRSPPPAPSPSSPDPVAPVPDLPLMQSSSLPPRAAHAGNRKSAEQLVLERLLSGAAFARESGARAAIANIGTGSAGVDGRDYFGSSGLGSGGGDNRGLILPTRGGGADNRDVTSPSGVNGRDLSGDASGENAGPDLGTLLRPTAIASARAKVLPTQRFLLAKGAFIDCTLETAINSTLPGMTTCITATDTFSSDGTVVLLERGTKLIGETQGQVQQGSARVFVLWTEARTPTGIVVPLDSPGTDELGRSGLPGQVNRHFWDRFGAAILISTLDGAVQAAVESAGRGGGAVIYSPSPAESVITDVLKSTVNVRPTVTKRNGDRIQVFVARDVDFRSVYELRTVTAGH